MSLAVEEVAVVSELTAHVERERNKFAVGDDAGGYGDALLKTIDQCLVAFRKDWEEFDEKWPDPGRPFRPALDLASHTGVLPFMFTKHVRDKDIHEDYPVKWYPSFDGGGGRGAGSSVTTASGGLVSRKQYLHTCFCIQIDALLPRRRLREDVLFADTQSNGVYPTDTVLLGGLSQEKYNGRKGIVQGKDPKNKNRFGVKMVDGGNELISLKPSNLTLEATGLRFKRNVSYQEALEIEKDLRTLDDLASWSLDMDLNSAQYHWYTTLRQQRLNKACGLVTCTNLLGRRGDLEPQIWKDALSVAAEALSVGGFFIQLDTDKHGAGFGDEEIMRKVGVEETMTGAMELVRIDRNPSKQHAELVRGSGKDKLLLVVWKKMGDARETQAELEYVWKLRG